MTLEEACVYASWGLTRLLLTYIAARGIIQMVRSKRRPDWPTFFTVGAIMLIGLLGCMGGLIRYLEGTE